VGKKIENFQQQHDVKLFILTTMGCFTLSQSYTIIIASIRNNLETG